MRHGVAVSTLALLVLAGGVIVLVTGCKPKEAAPVKTVGPTTCPAVVAPATCAAVKAPAKARTKAQAKVVNVRCPISGKKINRAKVPDSLIREYKGQKVGFCCPNCPPEWDKLTDAEKDAKLKAAMPKH